MTNRFTITNDFEEHYRQIRDNGHIIMGCFLEAQAEPIVKLLNELAEENQELKRLVKATVEDYTDLKKSFDLIDNENEQLKTDNGAFIQDIEVFKEENTHLKLENKQLKSFIDDLTTKGTGRIDLANGYSYRVSAVLTNWKGDVE